MLWNALGKPPPPYIGGETEWVTAAGPSLPDRIQFGWGHKVVQ